MAGLNLPQMGSSTPTPTMLPPHCSVQMVTPTSPDSAVTADIWLWNGDMLGTGDGGYSSAFSYGRWLKGLCADLRSAAPTFDWPGVDCAKEFNSATTNTDAITSATRAYRLSISAILSRGSCDVIGIGALGDPAYPQTKSPLPHKFT